MIDTCGMALRPPSLPLGLPIVYLVDDEDPSDLDTVFVPGLGAHAQALPWLGVLAGVHSGFSPVSPGQPEEVEPERSINYEAGVRIDHRTARTHTRADAIGFFNDYSNLTSECTISSGCDMPSFGGIGSLARARKT